MRPEGRCHGRAGAAEPSRIDPPPEVSHDITRLVSNPYLWNEYWREERRYQDLSRKSARIARRGSGESLLAVFPRLLVLRNQIVHGSAAEERIRRATKVARFRPLAC